MGTVPPDSPLSVGAPAPRFAVDGPNGSKVGFDTLAGRYLTMVFLGQASTPRSQDAIRQAGARDDLFDGTSKALFWISADPDDMKERRLVSDRGRVGVFWDFEFDISRAFGVARPAQDGFAYTPCVVILDPRLRIIHAARIEDLDAALDLVASLPPPGRFDGGTPAPVLVLPRVFEPELCRVLIETYEAGQPIEGGFMRQVGGKTVRVLDPVFKKRSDVNIKDEALRAAVRQRLSRRLAPEVERAFQFQATRIERYIVACYDSSTGGYFRPHRDNTTTGTAHRKFAVTINLNAEEYEGGDLRFPEFSDQTYRAPTGGAVVFSCSLMHEATAVTAGRRFAFLPFLYDEAGAAVREANLDTLGENAIRDD